MEVNAEGGPYGNALQAASYMGSEAIVKMLLENGAEVNAKGGKYGNALNAATFMGNKAIVELLLENGAEENNRKLVMSSTRLTEIFPHGEDSDGRLLFPL